MDWMDPGGGKGMFNDCGRWRRGEGRFVDCTKIMPKGEFLLVFG